MTKETKTTKAFDTILSELLDMERPLKAESLYRLSAIQADELQLLKAAWGRIAVQRRRQLLSRVNEAAETNFEMEFSALIGIALTDIDNEVRRLAVEASWQEETPEMATRLIALASGDIAPEVRAAAIGALGNTILLGELDQFDRFIARQAQNIALRLYRDAKQPDEVRRRALESLSNSSREEVSGMIEESYRAGSQQMRVSAVFAMGRSCDKRWKQAICTELDNDLPEFRFEAVRAAGELELREAVPQLGACLKDEDAEIVEMAVWALGEIGGPDATQLIESIMERAERSGNTVLLETAEEALQMAQLMSKDLGVED